MSGPPMGGGKLRIPSLFPSRLRFFSGRTSQVR